MGAPRHFSDIDTLVIHCSATPNGRAHTIEDIDRWHGERGWRRDLSLAPKWQPQLKHVGYHFVVELDGSLRAGRPFHETGAHAFGHNLNSIGICMIGTDQYSPAQWATLYAVVQLLTHPNNHLNGLQITQVVGHRDLSPDTNGDGEIQPFEWLKTCPGFSVSDWLTSGGVPAHANILEDAPCLH